MVRVRVGMMHVVRVIGGCLKTCFRRILHPKSEKCTLNPTS